MLGNGEIGAVIWVENNRLIFTLDKMDIWERRHIDIMKIKNYNYATLVKLLEKGEYEKARKFLSMKN